MRTDHLIAALAADTRKARSVWPDLLLGSLGPIFIMGMLLLPFMGLRHDIPSALANHTTLWKWALPLLVIGPGLFMARRFSDPDGRAIGGPTLLIMALIGAAGLLAAGFMVVPPSEWLAAIRGHTMGKCVISITGLGLSGLFCSLYLLRRGATTQPRLEGLATGLACGGIASILYAFHCPEDSPLFFISLYGSAILALGLVGAMLGPRMLRW